MSLPRWQHRATDAQFLRTIGKSATGSLRESKDSTIPFPRLVACAIEAHVYVPPFCCSLVIHNRRVYCFARTHIACTGKVTPRATLEAPRRTLRSPRPPKNVRGGLDRKVLESRAKGTALAKNLYGKRTPYERGIGLTLFHDPTHPGEQPRFFLWSWARHTF